MVDDEPEVTPAAEVTPYAQPIIGSSVGAIGLSGYADDAEYSGPPVVISYPPAYQPFLATDARSVLLTLLPQHYNMIPNPAFRVNGAGWVFAGIEPPPTAFSWRVAHGSAEAGLNAIINKTANAAVDPDPVSAPAYVNGQYVKVVDTLGTNQTKGWLKIENTATLTVAEAAGAGISITNPVPKYDPFNPVLHSLDGTDSWVGKSVACYGSGHLQYRAGQDRFVYVGPLKGTQPNQWDWRRGGPEWTFSVYVKGKGDVRLIMDAYQPTDRTDLDSGPEFQNLISVADPATYPVGETAIIETGTGRVWTALDPTPAMSPYYEDIGRGPALASVVGEWTSPEDDGEWHRVAVKTRARVSENEGQINFTWAWWIDAKIEIRSANGLKVSATMLDPNEYPLCAYFDGEMTENLSLDDFLWEGPANNSVSYYYFDRVIRAKWLYERMGYVVPAGRPYQIFFGSYWRPYVGKSGETIIMVPA